MKAYNTKIEQSLILEKLKSDEFKAKAKELNLKTALIFGSVITDEFNEESDVDLAILSEEKLKLSKILNLELFLEDLLGREIDVVDLNSDNLDIFIKINILNTGKTIYTSDDDNALASLIDKVEWYYRENETFFSFRKRDLLS